MICSFHGCAVIFILIQRDFFSKVCQRYACESYPYVIDIGVLVYYKAKQH